MTIIIFCDTYHLFNFFYFKLHFLFVNFVLYLLKKTYLHEWDP